MAILTGWHSDCDISTSSRFAELLTGQPAAKAETENFDRLFTKTLVLLLKKENFVKNLKALTGDTRAACKRLAAAPILLKTADTDEDSGAVGWRVTNPFDSFYDVVYQLTMRTVGADNIAEDPALLRKTLAIFERFEGSESTARVVFPWLPTLGHPQKMYSGARLAMVFQRLVERRRTTGWRRDDALQFLIDQGYGIRVIVAFEIGALFAGQLNSGINAAYLHAFLAADPSWIARVRDEVDSAVSKHRQSPAQTAADVLDTLTLADWEADFPLVDLCLRETIRLCVPGTAFRKNTSGHDVPIGTTGEVIPDGAFAAYLMDDVFLNEEWYSEPRRFDRVVGMRFAKLEMALITAYFVAMFDLELSNKDCNSSNEIPAPAKGVIAYVIIKTDPTLSLNTITQPRDGVNYDDFTEEQLASVDSNPDRKSNGYGLVLPLDRLKFSSCGAWDTPEVLKPNADGGQLELKGTVEVVSCMEKDRRRVFNYLRWGRGVNKNQRLNWEDIEYSGKSQATAVRKEMEALFWEVFLASKANGGNASNVVHYRRLGTLWHRFLVSLFIQAR
ncbi:Uu.00g070220.m01.CDS01 [Anthostomella pinea]|uniref:Uu.00g070220.m01.CDS01 n=1 Tax=Anthostomella pinea TaxID=933095 RepID=A0AAI8VUM5_9PEZI|nr:Uu.00g070220.m01.CDS01 [Anthostomella pinea]